MNIEDDNVIFSTGKVRYANNGIVGLAPDLEVFGGYDHGFFCPPSEWDDDPVTLTPAEQIELAEHMIAQWQRFRDRAVASMQSDAP